MTVLSRDGRNKLWFGTVDRMQWLPTPNRGADVSAQGWQDGGTMLNGGGYQLNSFGSAKNYIFEWPSSSSRETAQLMKSFSDGTYGRGLIYFLDPLTWHTNVLPAHWADPSMSLGLETPSLVPGVTPSAVTTTGGEAMNLPVRSAVYPMGLASMGPSIREVVARNLSTNPSFESGTGAWGVGTGAAVTRTTGANGVVSGQYGLQVEALEDATPTNVQITSRMEGVSEGSFVSVRQSMRRGTTGVFQKVIVGVNWYNGSTFISSFYNPAVAVPSGAASADSSRFESTFGPAPAGTTAALIVYRFRDDAGGAAPPAGSLVHMDAVSFGVGRTVSEASDQTEVFFDGSSGHVILSGETLKTSWSGVEGGSESTAYREVTTPPDLDESNSVFIPIPEGSILYLGAVYTSTGSSGVFYSPVSRGGVVGHPTFIPPAPPAGGPSGIITAGVVQDPGVIGVRVWVGYLSGRPGNLTLTALLARLGTSSNPVANLAMVSKPWVGGQGHSGCRFVGKPTYINYTGVDGGQVGFAASFREVGAWQGAF